MSASPASGTAPFPRQLARVTIWNGSTWKKAALSVPVGWLYGLSCLSGQHCVAVGQYLNNQALAYTWTGTAWKSAVPSGPAGPGTVLISVS
jgi:hypothetical protein